MWWIINYELNTWNVMTQSRLGSFCDRTTAPSIFRYNCWRKCVLHSDATWSDCNQQELEQELEIERQLHNWIEEEIKKKKTYNVCSSLLQQRRPPSSPPKRRWWRPLNRNSSSSSSTSSQIYYQLVVVVVVHLWFFANNPHGGNEWTFYFKLIW